MKNCIISFLRFFKKKVSSIDAPAKPYAYGIGFLKKQLRLVPPLTIIDVGFADGTPGLVEHFDPSIYQYVCIEANPNFFPCLDTFHKRYITSVIEKCFCGETEGIVSFNVNASGRSSRYTKNDRSKVLQVPMKTLDSIIDSHAITGPFLLKIDAEGAELDVLEGSPRVLQNCEVVIAEAWVNPFPETNEESFARLISFMDASGFFLYDIFGGSIHRNGTLKQIDAVFRKKSLL